MLSFGLTTMYLTIFPLQISPEIQWACPFGEIQIPNTNTNTNTNTKTLNSQFWSYSKVSYYFSTKNFPINPMGMSIWPNTNINNLISVAYIYTIVYCIVQSWRSKIMSTHYTILSVAVDNVDALSKSGTL